MKTNKLTQIVSLVKCSGPARKGTGQEQGGDHCDCIASGNPNKPKQHGADPHAKNCAVYLTPTVIITPDAAEPDACLWCVVSPASPDYHPYCSLDCATASAIDDERGGR